MLGSATGGGAVPVAETLHRIAEIAEQMPAVGHLDSISCALTDAVGISTGTTRATISILGRSRSHVASVAASRSGKRSMTSFVSRFTRIVP
jgi:hypothetical protein